MAWVLSMCSRALEIIEKCPAHLQTRPQQNLTLTRGSTKIRQRPATVIESLQKASLGLDC